MGRSLSSRPAWSTRKSSRKPELHKENKHTPGAGKKVQQLIALAAFPEDGGMQFPPPGGS